MDHCQEGKGFEMQTKAGGEEELGAFFTFLLFNTHGPCKKGSFIRVGRGGCFSRRAGSGWGLNLALLGSRAARMPKARRVHECESVHHHLCLGPCVK